MDRTLEAVAGIKSLGYPGRACVRRCHCDELPCPLLSWLCGQLNLHYPELKGGGGDMLLAGRLQTVLSDMSSPLADLTFDDRSTIDKITELQAAVIINCNDRQSGQKTTQDDSPREQRCAQGNFEDHCQQDEDCAASGKKQEEWIMALRALDMDATSHVTEVLKEVQSRVDNLPPEDRNPLLNASLTPEQWVKLEEINDILSSDYKCRRQMILKRFQVTLESFAWGDNTEERRKALDMIPPMTSLDSASEVSLPHVLAARVNQSCIEPIRPGKTTTVYKVMMGAVPDRGGRPGEIEPPMPSWGDRKSGPRPGRGGGGRKERRFGDKKKKKH